MGWIAPTLPAEALLVIIATANPTFRPCQGQCEHSLAHTTLSAAALSVTASTGKMRADGEPAAPPPPARVFQSPKYIQQPGALARIGEFVASAFPGKAKKAGLITSTRLQQQYGEQLLKSIADPGVRG